jgi:hypothetical protein
MRGGFLVFDEISFSLNKDVCPEYPVAVYITGGVEFSGGYRSLEVQAVDANGIRVYDWRGDNGVFNFSGSSVNSNGLSDGCEPVEVHQFSFSDDPSKAIVSQAAGDFSHVVDPGSFECCVAFGGGGSWCDNPQGACDS